MSNFAVYHSEKGKGSGGGAGNHIDRKEGMEHTYPHADPERKDLNINFKVYADRQNLKISEAINERIKEGYKGKRAIRKDSVKFVKHIMTGSHDAMVEMSKDKDKFQDWIKENMKFLEKEYGEKNIIRFNLHMDEKTPHIHAVTVPLTEDGRLSAREIFGNKKNLQERQDRYACAMEKFNLVRGVRSTGIKHEKANEYYARMEEAKKNSQNMQNLQGFDSFLGIKTENKAKTIEKQKKALEGLKMSFIELKEKAEREKNEMGRTNEKLLNSLKLKNRLIKTSLRGRADELSMDEYEMGKVKQKVADQLGEEYRKHFNVKPQNIGEMDDKQIRRFVQDRADQLEKKLTPEELNLLKSSSAVKFYQSRLEDERDKIINSGNRKNRGGFSR